MRLLTIILLSLCIELLLFNPGLGQEGGNVVNFTLSDSTRKEVHGELILTLTSKAKIQYDEDVEVAVTPDDGGLRGGDNKIVPLGGNKESQIRIPYTRPGKQDKKYDIIIKAKGENRGETVEFKASGVTLKSVIFPLSVEVEGEKISKLLVKLSEQGSKLISKNQFTAKLKFTDDSSKVNEQFSRSFEFKRQDNEQFAAEITFRRDNIKTPSKIKSDIIEVVDGKNKIIFKDFKNEMILIDKYEPVWYEKPFYLILLIASVVLIAAVFFLFTRFSKGRRYQFAENQEFTEITDSKPDTQTISIPIATSVKFPEITELAFSTNHTSIELPVNILCSETKLFTINLSGEGQLYHNYLNIKLIRSDSNQGTELKKSNDYPTQGRVKIETGEWIHKFIFSISPGAYFTALKNYSDPIPVRIVIEWNEGENTENASHTLKIILQSHQESAVIQEVTGVQQTKSEIKDARTSVEYENIISRINSLEAKLRIIGSPRPVSVSIVSGPKEMSWEHQVFVATVNQWWSQDKVQQNRQQIVNWFNQLVSDGSIHFAQIENLHDFKQNRRGVPYELVVSGGSRHEGRWILCQSNNGIFILPASLEQFPKASEDLNLRDLFNQFNDVTEVIRACEMKSIRDNKYEVVRRGHLTQPVPPIPVPLDYNQLTAIYRSKNPQNIDDNLPSTTVFQEIETVRSSLNTLKSEINNLKSAQALPARNPIQSAVPVDYKKILETIKPEIITIVKENSVSSGSPNLEMIKMMIKGQVGAALKDAKPSEISDESRSWIKAEINNSLNTLKSEILREVGNQKDEINNKTNSDVYNTVTTLISSILEEEKKQWIKDAVQILNEKIESVRSFNDRMASQTDESVKIPPEVSSDPGRKKTEEFHENEVANPPLGWHDAVLKSNNESSEKESVKRRFELLWNNLKPLARTNIEYVEVQVSGEILHLTPMLSLTSVADSYLSQFSILVDKKWMFLPLGLKIDLKGSDANYSHYVESQEQSGLVSEITQPARLQFMDGNKYSVIRKMKIIMHQDENH